MLKAIATALSRRALSALPSRTFDRSENPYLERFSLFRRHWIPGPFAQHWLPSIHPHYFFRGDAGDELHNHPWAFTFSIILSNGYFEERRVFGSHGEIAIRTRELRPGMLNVIAANDFHKIRLRDPERGCWTLFFAWRRMQDWGFWHPETVEFLLEGEHKARAQAARTNAWPRSAEGPVHMWPWPSPADRWP